MLESLKLTFFFSFACLTFYVKAQTATITGVVLDDGNRPLQKVNISGEGYGTFSDTTGFYILTIPADKATTITFSHVGHKSVVLEALILTTNETHEFNPVLKSATIQINEVTVTSTTAEGVNNGVAISPEIIRRIPGANAGVENILKLLPGVSSSNELSTQYNVRGGNYDENLVYINEIEVYRPFLVRSAQQEGMSFVNSDMIQGVRFSSGGFQAKYGDKLSSVLDITYKTPAIDRVQLDLSLLGAAATVETVSKDKNFNTISGIRYRNNSLLVNSQQTNTNFNPTFFDFQTYTTYRFSSKFQLNALATISVNDYQNEPIDRRTNFGTLTDQRSLVVSYEGEENNRYNTILGALKGHYWVNENITLKFITSLFHTTEEEYSDVIAHYELGPVENDLGNDNGPEPNTSRGIGSQFNRARNELDALILNLTHKGNYKKNDKTLEWGLKYTHEDIRDQLRESEFIDSAGFFIRPPRPEFSNNQPEEPFEAPLEAFESINARNFVQSKRLSGFVQFSNRIHKNKHDVYYNVGLRAQWWNVNGKDLNRASYVIFSPRAQFAVKPKWKRDMLFRLSGGLYQQPPFYRELRDETGTVIPQVKAQKSWHAVLGNEYSFTWWQRPFTLLSEVYYKGLDNINTYTLEDVRIRYSANNNAEAYVYGADLRLNGAFVPGTESWLSVGFLKTEENIDNKGYISRPTDQRLKIGMLYQDYIPDFPNFKMYLNLVYNTGVPGGSPSYADPYVFQSRLRDYKRADLGISHIFVGGDKTYPRKHWLGKFKELSAGFEIFNLFDNQNSITNTWVRDVDSKQQYAIPNFMTSRVFNLRVRTRF